MTSRLSTLFSSARPPKSIINFFSSGSKSTTGANSNVSSKEILSGALTSNTLKTLLSVTGAGAIQWLAAYAEDTTSRTIRLRVTIDGTVVFDATTDAMTTTNKGLIAVGAVTVGNTATALGNEPFNNSLLVEVASSLTETDKVGLGHQYVTR